jgi:hypothetical protein
LNLTGFLEKETPAFCKQLWNLLLSAQANPQGVPTELLEKKKEELRQMKVCFSRVIGGFGRGEGLTGLGRRR